MRLLLLALLLMGAAVPASAQKDKARDRGADSEGVYELRAVTVLPRPTNLDELRVALQANYPPALRAASVGAVVEVRFRVDVRGVPRDLTVTRSTHPEFDVPTLESVRVLRFAPAEVDGKPVPVWVVLPIQWSVAA